MTMFSQDEFKKYATKHKGISSLNLHRFESTVSSYINPTIIEERQLNVASMDVFSRLMMDRIIFLGVPIDDDVANIIMAQLLFLESAVLMTAGTKGKRSALQHSRIMIHQPMGGAQGQASDIEITAREIMKLKKELYQIIADHSGNSIKKVEKDSDRDYWMAATEAKEYGMIDTVLIREHK